jgi:hypothetical protein
MSTNPGDTVDWLLSPTRLRAPTRCSSGVAPTYDQVACVGEAVLRPSISAPISTATALR